MEEGFLTTLARHEWLIMLLIPLGLLLWEWRNIRREIRRAREAERREG
ncbi:hypothetical protein [Elioraea rosea]|nr:hypothetical protein [Elioraea rosea]